MPVEVLLTERVARRSLAIAILGGVVVCANVPLLVIAAEDRSWGALWIALFLGPAVNLALALVSLACTPWMKRLTGVRTRFHALASFLVPAAMAVADFFLIGMMGLHGC